uniref:Uncharacterized protein n=1 Tax=Cyanistes caeruleus TaxID=156563 RepID=A0A8C0V527_CYACU
SRSLGGELILLLWRPRPLGSRRPCAGLRQGHGFVGLFKETEEAAVPAGRGDKGGKVPRPGWRGRPRAGGHRRAPQATHNILLSEE